jgi:hypothetical protein
MHFPGPGPIGHGIGLIFGAIIWTIGSLIMLAIVVALIVLLARYLWFGTRASQRYLELNGEPARRGRAAPTAAPATASAPTAKPRTPRTPPAPKA